MRRPRDEIYETDDIDEVEEEEEDLSALEEAFYQAICRFAQKKHIQEFFEKAGKSNKDDHQKPHAK